MTPPEILFWKKVAEDLKIEVISPFEVILSDGTCFVVSALIKDFGGPKGMLVDADYDVLRPHLRGIRASGYGYSSSLGSAPEKYDRASMIDVLRDWEWSGDVARKPDWMR